MSLGWTNKQNVKFSTILRNKKPVLAIEPTENKSDGRLIFGKTFVSIRNVGAPFLPKELHRQKNLVAYVDEIASDKLITVALPNDYTIVNDNFESDQPVVSHWPDTSFTDQSDMHFKRGGIKRYR